MDHDAKECKRYDVALAKLEDRIKRTRSAKDEDRIKLFDFFDKRLREKK